MEKPGGKMVIQQFYSASYFIGQNISLQCFQASSDEAALEQAWKKGANLVGLYNHTKDTTVF